MPNSRTRAQWPASGIDLVRPSAKRRAEACTARTPQCDREGLKRTFLILAWKMLERHPEIQFPVTRDSCPAEECHRLRLRLGSGRPLPWLRLTIFNPSSTLCVSKFRFLPIRPNESPIDISDADGVGLGAFRTDPTNLRRATCECDQRFMGWRCASVSPQSSWPRTRPRLSSQLHRR